MNVTVFKDYHLLWSILDSGEISVFPPPRLRPFCRPAKGLIMTVDISLVEVMVLSVVSSGVAY